MERVAFIIEETGQRIGCLLNPEMVVVRRLAGVRPRRSAGGPVTAAVLADDPLLYTGGGTTELRLDLLFDVSLAGSSIGTDNVRELTRPLWELAENAAREDGYSRPPLVRFVWGKTWNIPGVVAAVAERLESFTPGGAPRRSWLRMRFLRVAERTAPGATGRPVPGLPSELAPLGPAPSGPEIAPEQLRVLELSGGTSAANGRLPGERLDEIAYRVYGDPSYWKRLAEFNDVDDPMSLSAGDRLEVPPASALPERP
ncbi:MAG: hypothetical protein HY704_01350 [Gemmatimonadetes bacterium]|nr:hypothetical protein [Gemmatimonadota bacterium]